MNDELNSLLIEMKRKEWQANIKGRGIKFIDDFVKEMRADNLTTLSQMVTDKMASPLTTKADKILFQQVQELIEKETNI